MILTEEQAKARLESGRNLLNRFGKEEPRPVVDVIPINRPGGDGSEVPREKRNELAARARLGENQTTLAREHGITQQAVNRYAQGKSVDNDVVESKMNEVQDVAMCRLLSSLGFLDDNKLSKLGAKELSAVAANMAKVVGNTREQKGNDNRVTVQLFAPELRKETSYKVLEVSSV